MLKWRFPATSPALYTQGHKTDQAIVSGPGTALFGPYIDLPAGRCTARILATGIGSAVVDITADHGSKTLAAKEVKLSGPEVEITADIEAPAYACEIRLKVEGSARITGLEIDLAPTVPAKHDPDRPVGHESRKTYKDKIKSGFIDKYLNKSAVVEIGYKGGLTGIVPIMPQAIGIDLDYPGYDGVKLPLADESVDTIYSSHCFEHVPDERAVLRDWWRVLKTGGHIVLIVPHQYLFEKRTIMPSLGNPDHKKFYTPEVLMATIAKVLRPNSYRIRHLAENDQGFNYQDGPGLSSLGGFEIETVIEKIQPPLWNSYDGTVRPYAPGEFQSDAWMRRTPWSIELDFPHQGRVAHGPYAFLQAGEYEAEYFVEVDTSRDERSPKVDLSIVRDYERITGVTLGPGAKTMVVPFSNDRDGAMFEFQMHVSDPPASGKLTFRGVVLRHPQA